MEIDMTVIKNWLGKEARSKLTGLQGVVLVVELEMNGNWRVAIHPPAKEGAENLPTPYSCDLSSCEKIGDKIDVTAQIKVPKFAFLDKVEDLASGFQGKIVQISWHLDGCIVYAIVSSQLNNDGIPPTYYTLEQRLKLKKLAKEGLVASEPTGSVIRKAVLSR